MSVRKLCLLILAFVTAAFAAGGALRVDIKEYNVPTPNARPR